MSSAQEFPGWVHVYSGKVRDLYVPRGLMTDDDSWTGDPLRESPVVLVVASDRVSALDHILRPDIPGKGAVLTALARWWFAQLRDIPNHLLIGDEELGGHPVPAIPETVADRAMLCRTLDMVPIECVVRGYLTGGGWRDYRDTGTIGGIALPPGLSDGDRLPEPIFTPAWKAPLGEHDENISFTRMIELVGARTANQLRSLSLRIFAAASTIAEQRGLLLADTKFEFGHDRATKTLTLGDEVLTPDSSRYWDAATYRTATDPAARMTSFDKQPVRDWLTTHWNQHTTEIPPPLSHEVVTHTAERYRSLHEKLTTVSD